ncbi:tRNA-uridine aminocarboxypropyltransferase [uncultured Paraglaciecola sp.]|uniref:tRNA-uridine aminocarboxypropyltransferase n=1 Tax=uncultured Paraglaciecola sp. TaxID=1765024 RepID=UPI002591A052|nr:tRNA-uridine aminocarboxypropyltransferase [uncultured Paraglaciecola sp.]
MNISNRKKREHCILCDYPQKTCLCAWIYPLDSPINIVILQQPKEAKHAKNTAKLLNLTLNRIDVLTGESPEDWTEFVKLVSQKPEKFSVCYPHEQSKSLESLINIEKRQDYFPSGHTVIFIDASWRKALKIWKLNPWMHKLQSWHFSAPPINQYKIRHTTQKNSLSTLESVAYILEYTHGINCDPLYSLFTKMQQVCFLENTGN